MALLPGKRESTPMVSMVSPRQHEHADDLLVVDSPPLRERLGETGFADSRLLAARPSFVKRAARAFIRYLIACCVGVAATLAWQSYGDAAKQTIAAWGTEQGWSMAWLSNGDVATPNSPSRPERTEVAPPAPAAPEIAGLSSDLQQLKTMTVGLTAGLTTMRERIEQLAGGQAQTANDIAKLQAAEQEIRHKIATIAARPGAAGPSRPAAPTPPRAPPPPR
jgi:hypothetical protein